MYKLKIEQPCSQKWSSMTENEKGRFCAKCSKNIIDLTQLSDAEILETYKANAGSLCGRITKKQNNSLLTSIKTKEKTGLGKVAAGFILFSLLNPNASSALLNEHAADDQSFVDQKLFVEPIETKQNVGDTTKQIIQGKVVDAETGDLLIGANIRLKGTENQTITDAKGNFSITVPKDSSHQKLTLVATFITYEKLEYELSMTELDEQPITIKLNTFQFLMGEVIITEPGKKK
ncbi:MAG: carboxypeptidase-like regulatory domain-containing protein [Bacteroidia bacterium]